MLKRGTIFYWSKFLVFLMLKNHLLKLNSSTISTVALQPIKVMGRKATISTLPINPERKAKVCLANRNDLAP